MSKASGLNQLGDDDFEAIRHLIRRDAATDLVIAREAERRGAKLGASDAAKAMAIARYRAGADFRRWLDRWENQDRELKRVLATQKQRFEFISNLVSAGGGKGDLMAVSNGLMARLLTLATEMSDEELKEAAAGQRGWIAKVIRVVQEQGKVERARTGEKALEISKDKKLTSEERESRLKEIFGIP